eukprot:COSAG01_NODE_2379_length_7794_cov_7.414295_9_plen_81_part_00
MRAASILNILPNKHRRGTGNSQSRHVRGVCPRPLFKHALPDDAAGLAVTCLLEAGVLHDGVAQVGPPQLSISTDSILNIP